LLSERDKASEDSLATAKKRLSDRLLPLPFVSGVGSPNGVLTIYLAHSLAPNELQNLKSILAAEAPEKTVEFVTTGDFSAR
jgi:hypothetical protein